MREEIANEVMILQYFPFGSPTSGLVPRFELGGVWTHLVGHCNCTNQNPMTILRHLWAKEQAEGTMHVPHFVAFIPEDPQTLWYHYHRYFNDRLERRQSVFLACGSQYRSGPHYLINALWWLVQDLKAMCSCEMTVQVMRPNLR